MHSYKENMVNELKVRINSLIELHMLKFIDDSKFYADIKVYMDKLDELNSANVIADTDISSEQMEGNESTQVDDVIKNLQSQLIAVKAENIHSMQNLVKETNSHVIDEQKEHLDGYTDYINNVIVPLKKIRDRLFEN